MTSDSEFRTPEQEVIKLLEECAELRQTLKSISAQIGRMESRIKKAFPNAAVRSRGRKEAGTPVALAPTEALAEFDRIVDMVAAGSTDDAQRAVEAKSAAELLAITRELGVSFPKSKPSLKAMREALFGKVRESVLLSRHHRRT